MDLCFFSQPILIGLSSGLGVEDRWKAAIGSPVITLRDRAVERDRQAVWLRDMKQREKSGWRGEKGTPKGGKRWVEHQPGPPQESRSISEKIPGDPQPTAPDEAELRPRRRWEPAAQCTRSPAAGVGPLILQNETLAGDFWRGSGRSIWQKVLPFSCVGVSIWQERGENNASLWGFRVSPTQLHRHRKLPGILYQGGAGVLPSGLAVKQSPSLTDPQNTGGPPSRHARSWHLLNFPDECHWGPFCPLSTESVYNPLC